MTDLVVEVSIDDADTPAASNVDVLREQCLRLDGYFTGPTW